MDSNRINAWLKIIVSFGYPGLFLGLLIEFLGLPFPGEIVLTFAGFMVWNKHLSLMGVIFASVLGSLTGTMIAFFIGRHYGRPILDKFGKYFFLNKSKINYAERLFNRHRFVVLLFGRFLPGVRPVSAYAAGIARMKFRVFLPLSLGGSLIWCSVFVILGTYLGQNWQRVTSLLVDYYIVIVGIILFIAIIFIVRTLAKRKKLRLK